MPSVNCSVGLKHHRTLLLWLYSTFLRLSSWWGWLKNIWIMIWVAVGTWSKNTKGSMHPFIWSEGVTGCNMGVALREDKRGPQKASLVWTLCKRGVSRHFIHSWAPLWLLDFAWEPPGPCSYPHLTWSSWPQCQAWKFSSLGKLEIFTAHYWMW